MESRVLLYSPARNYCSSTSQCFHLCHRQVLGQQKLEELNYRQITPHMWNASPLPSPLTPALLQGLLQEIYPESVSKIQQSFAAWHLEVNAHITGWKPKKTLPPPPRSPAATLPSLQALDSGGVGREGKAPFGISVGKWYSTVPSLSPAPLPEEMRASSCHSCTPCVSVEQLLTKKWARQEGGSGNCLWPLRDWEWLTDKPGLSLWRQILVLWPLNNIKTLWKTVIQVFNF